MDLDAVLQRIDDHFDESVGRLLAFLRIPSISTDPAHHADCRAAAQWLRNDLATLGFGAGLRETAGHPIVLATPERRPETSKPHILFYGHYDVEPIAPREAWHSDPFVPRIVAHEDGSRTVVARGASDDKGQLMCFVEAMRAIIAVGGMLPVPVTVLVEGEDEAGSPSLPAFLAEAREELRADAAFVCDTTMFDADTPAITMSVRGLVGEEITLRCANRDLHAGQFGGPVKNANRVLAKLLAALHDDEGRVTLPGFYDHVPEPPSDRLAGWDALGMTADAYLAPLGLSEPAGEAGRSVLEMVWSRPTLEITGLWGGYTGAGGKSSIPSVAHAVIAFRLVGEQNPEEVRENFRAFVRRHVPADCAVSFEAQGGWPASTIPPDWDMLAVGRQALQAEWGRPTAMIGMGRTVPIVRALKQELGLDTLLIGFGLEDDNIHDPNEKFDLRCFRKGIRSWARVLAAL